MSEKSVDGVKKLSKEDIGRSRNIVLDAINDREAIKKANAQAAGAALKAVDSVMEPLPKPLKPKLDKKKKEKSREEPSKIILDQKEKISEKKISGKSYPDIRAIPSTPNMTQKAPIIKLSREKKKKWREEFNKELIAGQDIKKDPVLRPDTEPRQKQKSNKIATDFLAANQDQDFNKLAEKETPMKKKLFDIHPKKKFDPGLTAEKRQKKIISQINSFDNEIITEKIYKEETGAGTKLKPSVLVSKKENTKLTKAEKKKKQEEEKKKKEIEKGKLRAKKQAETKKRKDIKKKQKACRQRQREEKKKEHKEKIINIRNRLNQATIMFFQRLLDSCKRTLMLGLFGLAVALLLYTSLLIVIIEYSIDNKATRQIARLIPIPAYVGKYGIVNYFTYQDIRLNLELSGLSDQELTKTAKIAVVEKIIIDNLARRYSLMPKNMPSDQSDIRSLLNERIVFDQDINQVGIKRIKKIKELIDQGGDFVKVANKYGDGQDQITLNPINEEEYDYYKKVSGLNVGDVSEIIYTDYGYYLFRCFDKKNDNLYLSFVYVRAKTLSEYVDESITDYKLWSLVD